LIEVHLYGKLRRFAERRSPLEESTILSEECEGDTIGSLITRLGIPLNEVGSNIFLNGSSPG